MYEIVCDATIDGNLDSVWSTWTDLPSYPDWDPREQEARLDGPFEAGTTGFSKQVGRRPGSPFKLTRVTPNSDWTNECPLPGGKLVMVHRLVPDGNGRVRLTKTYQVHGPLSILFRIYYGREIRRNMPTTFAALDAEATRRRAATTG